MAFTPNSPPRNLRNALVAVSILLLGAGALPGQPVEYELSSGRVTGFTSPPPLPVGWLGGADFDGDGDRDIYVELEYPISESLGYDRAVLENLDGSALNLTTHGTPFLEREPWPRFPDINGDGRDDLLFLGNDLVWGAFVDESAVLLPVFDGSTDQVIPIDWDFDSDIDLVARHPDAIRWHENGGGLEPTFTEHLLLDDPVWGMEFGDLDGDLRMDFVMASGEAIFWHRNLGGEPPAFERSTILETGSPSRVRIRDVDLDGAPDVLCIVGQNLVWLENLNGDASAWVQHVIEDGGGLEDFAGVDNIFFYVEIESNGYLSPVALHSDGNVFQYRRVIEAPNGWRREPLGDYGDSEYTWVDDLDDDGHADVLEVNSRGFRYEVFVGCAFGTPPPCSFPDFPLFVPRYGSEGSASWWDSDPTNLSGWASLIPSSHSDEFHTLGEEGLVRIRVRNEGSEPLTNLLASAESQFPHIVFSGMPATLPSLAPGGSVDLTFPYRIAEDAECDAPFSVRPILVCDQGIGKVDEIHARMGRFSETVTHTWSTSESVPVPTSPEVFTWSIEVDLPPDHHVQDSGLIVRFSTDRDLDGSRDHSLVVQLTEPDGTAHSVPVDYWFNPFDPHVWFQARLLDFATHGPLQSGTYTVSITDTLDDVETFVLEWRSLGLGTTDQRCAEFSSDELLFRILGVMDPDPTFDYNLDGRVDSADLVWALNRGY